MLARNESSLQRGDPGDSSVANSTPALRQLGSQIILNRRSIVVIPQRNSRTTQNDHAQISCFTTQFLSRNSKGLNHRGLPE